MADTGDQACPFCPSLGLHKANSSESYDINNRIDLGKYWSNKHWANLGGGHNTAVVITMIVPLKYWLSPLDQKSQRSS